MWWIIIIGIVVIMLIRFASDYNKQANTVIKQGGMRGKYKTLINHILRQDSSARIIQETNTFISVGLTGISWLYYILHTSNFWYCNNTI